MKTAVLILLSTALSASAQWGEWVQRWSTYEVRSNLWAALGERAIATVGTNSIAEPSKYWVSRSWLAGWDSNLSARAAAFVDPDHIGGGVAWSNGPPMLTYSGLVVRVGGPTNGAFASGYWFPSFSDYTQRQAAVSLLQYTTAAGGWLNNETNDIAGFTGAGTSTNSAADANTVAIANVAQDDGAFSAQGSPARWRFASVSQTAEDPDEWTASIQGFSERAYAVLAPGLVSIGGTNYAKSATLWFKAGGYDGVFDAQGETIVEGWNEIDTFAISTAIALTNETYRISSDLSFPPNDPYVAEGANSGGFVTEDAQWIIEWTGFDFN